MDKLSIKTTVFTKSVDDDTYIWKIDWQQFENAYVPGEQNEITTESIREYFEEGEENES